MVAFQCLMLLPVLPSGGALDERHYCPQCRYWVREYDLHKGHEQFLEHGGPRDGCCESLINAGKEKDPNVKTIERVRQEMYGRQPEEG